MKRSSILYEEFDILSKNNVLQSIYPVIPKEIIENINKKFKLRDYQEEAFRRFFYFLEKYDKKWPLHILFNMATGSGKTLIMAGLILNLYNKGYRNFIFFVNSKNIIAKTKKNFIDNLDDKYLFNDVIEINNEKVEIKQVEDLVGLADKDINIYFTTIQKFHGDLSIVKENSLTFEDFENSKTVFIADEAHHLNVSTKKQKEEEKENWEDTVIKALNRNSKNMLLEFTATVEINNQKVRKKYTDKVLYKFDLVEFRDEGYSKQIRLFESDFNKKERIIQALIINEYRRQIAIKSKIPELNDFKPVILFKSKKTIEESKNNFFEFMDIIDNLNQVEIRIIRKNIGKSKLLTNIFDFFNKENISDNQLISILKQSFSKEKCLLTNEEDLDKKTIKEKDIVEILNQQDVLNSLENKNNRIRAIFTVRKLTEGWDVLNLFDIVRLYKSQTMGGKNKKKPGKTTIQEAQLIGRGARYYPFNYNDQVEDKRKFDNETDNKLRILEEVHYHCHPGEKSRYISEITDTLISMKWLDEEGTIQKELRLKENFKKESLYKYGKIYANKKIKKNNTKIKNIKDLGVTKKNIEFNLVSGFVKEEDALEEKKKLYDFKRKKESIFVRDIQKNIIKKGISKSSFYNFNNLKKYISCINSIDNFINDSLEDLRIDFIGTKEGLENISNKEYLNAIIKLLNKIEKEIKENYSNYKGSYEFYPRYKIKELIKDIKTLEIKKGTEREKGQEDFIKDKDWYVFESNFGTQEEKSLVEFMDEKILKLSKDFKDIFLIRNERDFKIYDFEKGRAFEPDFILFLTNKKTNKELCYQIFIEPKGEGFKEKDSWKEEFLLEIRKKYSIVDKDKYFENKDFIIFGAPFYNQNNQNVFGDKLQEELEF